ncbi:UNVERIFIED_CONTAM: hypothetical protein PYX00_008393 [Menopon gallinae]|uniref:Congested-like trachea protein n=1 Tax=Menopon gallinae TaxID=328185 RepID=A0AAW2HMT3_9NEOP
MEKEAQVPVNSKLQYFLCGGFGGICTVILGHPLDTIKVRLQTMPKPPPGVAPMYTSTWDCARKTFKYEGVRGLYKGMSAPLTGVAPIFAFSFFGYSFGKDVVTWGENRKLTNTEFFLAGAFSGIYTTFVMAPGERIKTLIQVQQGGGPQKYSGPIDVIKDLYKTGGIRSIFKGTLATFLRDVPGSGMYFMTYEILKERMADKNEESGVVLRTLKTAFAGGMSGIFYWALATPADVIKNRLQGAPEGKYPNGMRSAFTELVAEAGPLGFYKGITPVMLRAFFANGACFVGFEFANACVEWFRVNF